VPLLDLSPPASRPTTDPGDAVRAAAGDRDAFARLYEAHAARVFALCARMTADRALAEELTQDAFVRAWEKLPLFRGESSFGTWLHRLTVNVVLNHREADGRRRRHHAPDDDGAALDRAPARPHAPGDRMDLEQAIAALPPGARRVFVLYDVEGYQHEEIARLLGITSGGSKAQLHRARMLLREALQR
jgi:RNA polymerase sigma-70 factor (ECF subfamily)